MSAHCILYKSSQLKFQFFFFFLQFHANYNPEFDSYLAHRIIQAFDTASFIHHTSSQADLSLLAGDLNSEPSELCMQLLIGKAELKDTFFECVSAFILF